MLAVNSGDTMRALQSSEARPPYGDVTPFAQYIMVLCWGEKKIMHIFKPSKKKDKPYLLEVCGYNLYYKVKGKKIINY